MQLYLYHADITIPLSLPYADGGVQAGFPSPAQDYMADSIDLNRELIEHPSATFYARVVGDSMIEEGIEEGDILVVDKALEPENGDLAVCCLNGEFTLKRLHISDSRVRLIPSNRRYHPIEICEGDDFMVWGVVAYTIKANRRPRSRKW